MYSGVEAFSNYGFIYSHTSYTGDSTSTYGNGLRQKWHIRVQQGYRVKITFLGFELEGCCDYVYLTWDVCDYNGAYSVRLGGSSLATTVYYSPPRVNNIGAFAGYVWNLIFRNILKYFVLEDSNSSTKCITIERDRLTGWSRIWISINHLKCIFWYSPTVL